MTREELASVIVGARVRRCGNGYALRHVVAIVEGKGANQVAVLAYWSKRYQCWRHEAVDSQEMEIMYDLDGR